MSFLDAFDALTKANLDERATELLYSWMLHREQRLYFELRARPILKFWSLHPGNPDFYSDNVEAEEKERRPGWAYLLTSSENVQLALNHLSMRPYESWDRDSKKKRPWLLSTNERAEHTSLRAAMSQAMTDGKFLEKIDRAVRIHWHEVKANLAYIDARQYFRRVALSFVGFYFGLPRSFIFETAPVLPQFKPSPSGIENLERWSGEGYENFIWKIHARHFDRNMPPLEDALRKIYFLVAYMSANPMKDTVIDRFNTTRVPSGFDTKINIVGMIQGLVDNMMTSACIALRQLIDSNQVAAAADLNLNNLVILIRKLQVQKEAPSPFLPRFGQLAQPTSDPLILQKYSALKGANIVCATGAAMTDPFSSSGIDIRLGYGMHECIGRWLGDQLTAAALQPLLKLKSLQTVRPLTKKWSWIPQQYVVAADSHRRRSQVEVDRVANAAPPRPYPYSLWSSRMAGVSDYVSWPALADKTYFSRHLGPASDDYRTYLKNVVPVETVSRLFERPDTGMVSGRSTLLFCFFAQWLIDSFLRTDPNDRRRTTSNHQLDLCQIYGLNETTTRILRSGVDGKMKSDVGGAGEFPQRLFDKKSGNVRQDFQELPYVASGQLASIIRDLDDREAKIPFLCASGLERGNSTVGYTALNTLFLREHNRICDELKVAEGVHWDDERLFQTVRMIMVVLEIKIIIDEYINHINTDDTAKHQFSVDPAFLFAERRHWYRTNWMSVEFDLLYRWHSLVPDRILFAGRSYAPRDFRGNNKPLFDAGLGSIFTESSRQSAGRIALFNSPQFLWPAERAAVTMARNADLQPFNRYRERFGIPPIRNFSEFGAAGAGLEAIYKDVDKVEFLPGVFAEAPQQASGNLFGTTMMTMVGYDAFTHALTNPLLSEDILNEACLTKTGMDIINQTSRLQDLLSRNEKGGVASFD